MRVEDSKCRINTTIKVSLLIFFLFTFSCRREKQESVNNADIQHSSTYNSIKGEQTEQGQIGYAKGTWWQEKDRLKHVILSAAHILVSHRQGIQSIGRIGIWVPELPERTKQEALRLAYRVASLAQQSPDRFGEYAGKYSDDAATAQYGGRIGVFRAVGVPPSFIDALGNLSVGEVSRVVKSKYGFHIIKRLRVPDDQKISANQILIEYRGLNTEWTHGGQTSEYSREEARKIAERIAEEAKRAPESFSKLSKKYSHDVNAENGGDLGVWSTYEIGIDPIVLEIVSRLKPGEVSGVVDTSIGFRIFKRSNNLKRDLLAASIIVVAHDDVPSAFRIRSVKRTRSDASALAEQIATRLVKHPDRFSELNREHCDIGFCKNERISWPQGRMLSKVETVVSKLKIGEVSTTAIDTPLGFFVVRREDPGKDELLPNDPRNHPVTKNLPRPAAWTIADYSKRFPPHIVVRFVSDFKDKAIDHLELEGSTKDRFSAIYNDLSYQMERRNKEEYAEIIEAAEKRVAKLLGTQRFSEYLHFKDSWFKQLAARVPIVI